MNGREKSDPAFVAVKPANKPRRSAEGRTGAKEKAVQHRAALKKRQSTAPVRARKANASPTKSRPRGGQKIKMAVANTVLGNGEFAITTYAFASIDSALLPPTTLACWGPGQTIKQSFGAGNATYNFIGGVVIRGSLQGEADQLTAVSTRRSRRGKS